MINAPNEVQTT